MYVLSIIDPNGDYQKVVEYASDVAEVLDGLDWSTVVRVVVSNRQ